MATRHAGRSIKSNTVAQVVPFSKNGSEIAKAHWTGQACMLNRYVAFFLHVQLPSMSPLRASNRGRTRGSGHNGLFQQQSAFSPDWPQSPSACVLAVAEILRSVGTPGTGMSTSKRNHWSRGPQHWSPLHTFTHKHADVATCRSKSKLNCICTRWRHLATLGALRPEEASAYLMA